MVKPPCAMQGGDCDSSDEDTAEDDLTPLYISWLPLSPVYSSEFLGISSLPGCRFKDIRRNLQKDIEELKKHGTQDMFVLCTRGELLRYRVPNLIEAYQEQEICVHHYPIPDGDVPDIAMCCKILEELRSCLESNRKTVIHCFGGLGRSCLIAACLLLQLSDALTPQQVIDNLRSLRGSGAIQTIKQYNFLHDFREKLTAHLATKGTALRSVSREQRLRNCREPGGLPSDSFSAGVRFEARQILSCFPLGQKNETRRKWTAEVMESLNGKARDSWDNNWT